MDEGGSTPEIGPPWGCPARRCGSSASGTLKVGSIGLLRCASPRQRPAQRQQVVALVCSPPIHLVLDNLSTHTRKAMTD